MAVLFMNCLQTTEVKRRVNPADYLSHDFYQDYVTTWDYESFTTNLGELKFFLYNVSRAMEDRGASKISLFDYRLGEILADPVEMIREYNETVNVQSPFSIHRIVDRFLYDEDPNITYRQQNSGMLGVAGNIGFSTSLHGYMIESFLGPEAGVCVGDDAKVHDMADPTEELIPLVKVLGRINDTKFQISPPGDFDPFRFTKRAVYRDPNGSFFLEELYNLPFLPLIDGRMGHRDFIGDASPEGRMKKVVKIICVVMTKLEGRLDILDDEMSILLILLQATYNRFGIRPQGFLPGYFHRQTKESPLVQMSYAAPNIEFGKYDPRMVNWFDYMMRISTQETITLLVLCPRNNHVELPSKGSKIYAPMEKMWRAFEDLGLVKMVVMVEAVIVMTDEATARLRRSILKTNVEPDYLVPMYEISIVRDIPNVYHSLFVPSITDASGASIAMEI
jgi:hypothetical protein